MDQRSNADVLLSPAHADRWNITTSCTLKSPSDEAMNNSVLWSTTSSTANSLWLQVMKLVRGPVLIFPHFLSSRCKWRGINLKYWLAGLSEVLSGHSQGPHAPFPLCSSFFSHLPVRKSRLCSIFSFLGRYTRSKMRKRFSYRHPWIWYQGDSRELFNPTWTRHTRPGHGCTRKWVCNSWIIWNLSTLGNVCYSLNVVEECPERAVGYSV